MRIELFEVPSSEASSTSPPQAAVDAVHVEHPPPGRVGGDDQLAGGESLVPLMNCRLARPEVLVDLFGRDGNQSS
jgi:hypothetical protein